MNASYIINAAVGAVVVTQGAAAVVVTPGAAVGFVFVDCEVM